MSAAAVLRKDRRFIRSPIGNAATGCQSIAHGRVAAGKVESTGRNALNVARGAFFQEEILSAALKN
jgi:hypothetical protein